MNNNHDPKKLISFLRFSALLPVAAKGSAKGNARNYCITTLAASYQEAEELAAEAGLVLLGQLDTNDNIMKL